MTSSEIINQVEKHKNVVFLYCEDRVENRELLRFFKDKAFAFSGVQSMVLGACGFAVRGKMPIVVSSRESLVRASAEIEEAVKGPGLNVKFLCDGKVEELDKFESFELMLSGFGPGFIKL